MTDEKRQSIVALPVSVLAAAGLAFAGSQGSVSVAGVPLYALCVAVAFIIQWLAFIPAYINQTEKFYDLTGSITYITVILAALVFTPTLDARSMLLAVLVWVWAIRLGTFLFRRIQSAGKDDRFDAIKPDFARFLLTWTLQGLWVSFSLAAALAAITAVQKRPLGIIALIGGVVWLVGFGIEVIADRQKKQFRADPANDEAFIAEGLWSWSRHPNYFGEIVLWLGIAIIAAPVLQGWQRITLISPLFVTLLLTRISGVPLLEAKADEQWGGQPDYEAYKARTSVLIPLPPSDD